MTTLPILIPKGSIIMVKVGDNVKTGDVLSKRQVKRDVEIDLASALNASPQKIKKYLKKNPGDSITDGEVIASRSKLLGMQEEKILSHVTGTVSKYDRASGNLSIVLHDENEESEEEEIRSPIDGTIELCDNDQILIKTDKNVLAGKLGTGDTVEAEVYLLEDSSSKGVSSSGRKKPEKFVVQLHHMDTNIIDKILLGGVMDRDVLVKAIGMGVRGIIGASIKDEDIQYINERALGVPVICVEEADFSKLTKWNGKKVFMNGTGKTILFLQK